VLVRFDHLTRFMEYAHHRIMLNLDGHEQL
jgi:hypothetical protein